MKEILAILFVAFFINHKVQSDIHMMACLKDVDGWDADCL